MVSNNQGSFYPHSRCYLKNGDLLTMEGMHQKFYVHRLARYEKVERVRINMTWRWIIDRPDTKNFAGERKEVEENILRLQNSNSATKITPKSTFYIEIQIFLQPKSWFCIN